MKVDLLIRPERGWMNPDFHVVHLRKAVPFFKSQWGSYIHRIRSGKHYFRYGEYSHTAFELWCGMKGFHSKKHSESKLMDQPARDCVICATCEGRAIGSGQAGAPVILGRTVKFWPRT